MSQTPAPTAAAPSRPVRPAWRTILWIAGVALIAIFLGFLLSRCAQSSSGSAGAGRPTITVGVAKATLGDVPITVNFREGQTVRKGAVLATIDPAPFRAALQQARGQLARDQATLAEARLDLTRYQELLAENSIARQQVDIQAATVKQDEGVVQSDQAAVVTAELNLSYTQLPAPVGGRVGLRQIDPGNEVTANQTIPIAVVTQMDPIDVVFAIPEDSIPSLTGHGSFGAGLPVTAYARAGGGQPLAQGSLATIDNIVDTTTGTVKGKAQFANSAGALFPNQFVNVTVLVDTMRNQVIVPTTAVRHGPNGDFVYVLQRGQIVRVRPVTVGPGTAETTSIASGLAAGETVVTEGGDRLTDCARVNLPGHPAGGGRGGHGHGGQGGGARPGGGWSGGGSSTGAGCPASGGGRHGGAGRAGGGGAGGGG